MKKSLPVLVLLSAPLLFAVLCLSSCEPSASKRSYEELVSEDFYQDSAENSIEQASDPHALLQEMIARGEDPHAFLKEHAFLSDPQAINPHEFPSPSNPSMTSDSMSENLLPSSAMPTAADQSLFSWNVPAGWSEKPANGMRLASFSNSQYPSLDVSIVSLGGIAGGLSANINRWLNQIHLPPLSEEEVDQFLSKQQKLTSSGGLSVQLVDLTVLHPQSAPATPSMLAAIVDVPDKTVFVKMSGTIEDIQKNKAMFSLLCQSLRINE